MSEEPDLSCPGQLMGSSYSPGGGPVRELVVHARQLRD